MLFWLKLTAESVIMYCGNTFVNIVWAFLSFFSAAAMRLPGHGCLSVCRCIGRCAMAFAVSGCFLPANVKQNKSSGQVLHAKCYLCTIFPDRML